MFVDIVCHTCKQTSPVNIYTWIVKKWQRLMIVLLLLKFLGWHFDNGVGSSTLGIVFATVYCSYFIQDKHLNLTYSNNAHIFRNKLNMDPRQNRLSCWIVVVGICIGRPIHSLWWVRLRVINLLKTKPTNILTNSCLNLSNMCKWYSKLRTRSHMTLRVIVCVLTLACVCDRAPVWSHSFQWCVLVFDQMPVCILNQRATLTCM